MKVSKFLSMLLVLTVMFMMFTVAFAESGDMTNEENSLNISGDKELIATEVEEETAASGEEEIVTVSGEKEEVVASGEKEEAVPSGEEVEVVASGDKEVATSGEKEEKVVSGEEVIATSGDVSGDAVPVVSGDEEVPAFANDVDSGDWYYSFVEKAIDLGIMKNDEDGNFNPNAAATREDAFDALTNAFDASYKLNTEDPEAFLDQETTREEVTYITYLYVQSIGEGFEGTWMYLLDYTDKEDISEEAYEAIAWCSMNEVVIGRPDGTFGPKDTCTRAELATIMVRLVDLLKD